MTSSFSAIPSLNPPAQGEDESFSDQAAPTASSGLPPLQDVDNIRISENLWAEKILNRPGVKDWEHPDQPTLAEVIYHLDHNLSRTVIGIWHRFYATTAKIAIQHAIENSSRDQQLAALGQIARPDPGFKQFDIFVMECFPSLWEESIQKDVRTEFLIHTLAKLTHDMPDKSDIDDTPLDERIALWRGKGKKLAFPNSGYLRKVTQLVWCNYSNLPADQTVALYQSYLAEQKDLATCLSKTLIWVIGERVGIYSRIEPNFDIVRHLTRNKTMSLEELVQYCLSLREVISELECDCDERDEEADD